MSCTRREKRTILSLLFSLSTCIAVAVLLKKVQLILVRFSFPLGFLDLFGYCLCYVFCWEFPSELGSNLCVFLLNVIRYLGCIVFDFSNELASVSVMSI